jgi:PAS domain S-box-containing protein
VAEKPTYEELEKQIKYLESELERNKQGSSLQLEFSRLCEQSQDMIYYYRIATKEFSFLNSSSAIFFGFREKDGIRIPSREVLRRIHPDHLQTVRAAQLKSLIPGCNEGQAEYLFLSSRFGWRWLHDKWVVIKDDQDRPVAIIGIARDETIRKQTEQRLIESESLYRTVFNVVECATILLEEDLTISMVNRAFERLTGYDRSEVEGTKKWMDLIIKEDVAAFDEMSRLLYSNFDLMPLRSEMRIVNKMGQTRHIIVTMEGVPGTCRKIASAHDVTAIRNMEKTLAKSERRCRRLANLVPRIVFELNLDGIFTFLNEKAFALSGYTEEDVIRGITLEQWVIPSDRVRVRDDMHHILNGEIIKHQEYTIRKKGGGGFSVVTQASPIVRNGRVVGLRGVATELAPRNRCRKRSNPA